MNKLKWIFPLFMAITLFSFSGCVDDAPETPSITITIDNQSSFSIMYVYIKEASVDSWGDNRLGTLETIGTGETRSFTVEMEGEIEVGVDTLTFDAESGVQTVADGERYTFTVTDELLGYTI